MYAALAQVTSYDKQIPNDTDASLLVSVFGIEEVAFTQLYAEVLKAQVFWRFLVKTLLKLIALNLESIAERDLTIVNRIVKSRIC